MSRHQKKGELKEMGGGDNLRKRKFTKVTAL